MISLPPLLLVLGAASLFPEQEGGAIAGKISSPAGEPIPGVVVMVSSESATEDKPRLVVTDGAGEFSFSPLPPGSYRLLATSSGYEDATIEGLHVEGGQTARVAVTLELRRFSESVVVRGVTPISEPVEAARPVEITLDKLDLLPLSTDRFQDAFPLLPGVVRDPEGRLSFNGARPSQSILLVNGSNVTDPVTGDFAVNLPLRAIETVRVNEIPYSAEYGRVTAAVAEVQTRRGTDKWKLDTGDLIPRPNFRDGTIKGIRSFVPQVGISGPISKGKLWLSQSVAYRFVRARTYDVTYGADESIIESYDSFTQLDWRMAENHSLTTTFSWFPQQVDNLGLNALTTSDATPDFDSSGWNAAVSERSALGATTIETSVAVKRFDLSLHPKSEEASSLTPDGLRDNYFDLIESAELPVRALLVNHATGERLLGTASVQGRSEPLPDPIRRHRPRTTGERRRCGGTTAPPDRLGGGCRDLPGRIFSSPGSPRTVGARAIVWASKSVSATTSTVWWGGITSLLVSRWPTPSTPADAPCSGEGSASSTITCRYRRVASSTCKAGSKRRSDPMEAARALPSFFETVSPKRSIFPAAPRGTSSSISC